jgi:RNA polymerase sigma factor (TIGR02999 family)
MLSDCYEELRRIARHLLGGDRARLLIQPTELAHEATIRLLQLNSMQLVDREHLLATAARLARQALIDEIRRTGRLKRQAPAATLTVFPDFQTPVALESLHAAIEALTAVSPEHARLVELRFTLGMTVDEAAATTGLSARTVKRRWQATRAWLLDWMERNDALG